MTRQLERGKLGAIARFVDYRGKTPTKTASGVPLITAKNIRPGFLSVEPREFIAESNFDSWMTRGLPRVGDVLITTEAPLGNVVCIDWTYKFALAQRVICLQPNGDAAFGPFLAQVLQAPNFQAQLIDRSTGTTVAGIKASRLKELEVPLPPLNEQRRIVAKLEALQARSRRAREALDAVPPLLEKLRQSILAAAFAGTLTKDWRAKNKNVEPASELLKRIRTERRKKWEEAELAKMKAKGKTPTDDKWKAKYKEPEPVHATGLPELPEGWCWASLDELLTSLRNGISIKPDRDNGLRILRISAVRALRVDVDDVRFLASADAHSGYLLTEGDLLITRYNGNPELVGVAGVVRGLSEPTVYPDKLIRAVCLNSVVSEEFLALALNTGQTRQVIAAKSKSAAGQVGVSGSDLKCAPVPVPPLSEQEILVRAVNTSLEPARVVNSKMIDAAARLTQLEAATLSKAFRGELVSQEPGEESPSLLRSGQMSSQGTEADSDVNARHDVGRQASFNG